MSLFILFPSLFISTFSFNFLLLFSYPLISIYILLSYLLFFLSFRYLNYLSNSAYFYALFL